MKMLFVDFTLPQLLKDAEFPAGGWAVQLRQLLMGLAETGHCCGVLTWKGANAYVGPQSICDLIETYDPKRAIRRLRLLHAVLPSYFPAARAYRPDIVVQSCAGVDTGIMALIAQSLRVPFVHRIANDRDTDGRYALELGLRDRIGFHYGLRRSRFLICQNSYQLGNIAKRYPDKPSSVIHNAIQIPASAPALRPRSDRSYVAWLGGFARRKNLPLLFEVARELPEIEFRIAGALTQEAKHAPTLLALDRLKELGNVKFVGYLKRKAVLDFLNGAIALLSTSDFEGFSNTFLESFVTGTPVVLRSIVDPDSIVEKNGLGLVARDGTDLMRGVREICAMEADRHEALGRHCRQYVESHHTPIAAVRKLVSLLEPLVATR
ncbi:MAG TPA: glycosyltransferase family 4 protein [Rhizomicrobium sp.]